jgi:hypothetical protein
VITEREYREIEAHVDEALGVFQGEAVTLTPDDRKVW